MHLFRFLEAQENTYSSALREIKSGRKTSHWMWFIFPQITGLGSTDYSIKYSIKSVNEARSYLKHPVLGKRLIEISSELLNIQGKSALDILGSPDNKKLRSSMTLFNYVSGNEKLFQKVLNKYFEAEPDSKTLQIIDDLNV